jgi:hypothetical protein
MKMHEAMTVSTGSRSLEKQKTGMSGANDT